MNEITQVQPDSYPEALLINLGNEVQSKIIEALSRTEIKWSSYYRNLSTKLVYSNLMPMINVHYKAYGVFIFDYNSFNGKAFPKWLYENFLFLDKISFPHKYPIVAICEKMEDEEFDYNDVLDFFENNLKLPCYVRVVNHQKHKWIEEFIEHINEAWSMCIDIKDLDETIEEEETKCLKTGESPPLLTIFPFSFSKNKLAVELSVLYKSQLVDFHELLTRADFDFDVNYNSDPLFQNFLRFTDSIVGKERDLLIKVFKALLKNKSASEILKKCVEELTT